MGLAGSKFSSCKRKRPNNPSSSPSGHFGPGAVGIVAMEAYFPSTYVDQAELER